MAIAPGGSRHAGADRPAGAGTLVAPAAAADPALARLIDQVCTARTEGHCLRLRGGGTKDFYGGEARGQPLELAQLCGISSYEPTEMVITARAGTPLAQIEAVLAERGQCLAFEPPRFGPTSTVGGMVAAGLAGPARAAVGGLRDFVLGAVLLDGQGQLLRFGGQVMKNVAGYDISRLLVGSLGILGIICEVSLKVLPLAPARRTLSCERDQASALQSLNAWAADGVPIRASAWRGGRLLLRLEGSGAAVDAGCSRLRAETGAVEVLPAAAATYWDGLRDQCDDYFLAAAAAPPGFTLWRLSVPATHPPLELSGDLLIEWSGAQRWVCTALPSQHLRALAAAAAGHATAFRGTGSRHEVFTPLSPPLEQIHRRLKQAFDPAGIFNPGRLYPWL